MAVAVAWALGQSLGLAALLRRHVVGNDNDLFAFIGGTGWEPPLPPVVLWVLGVVTALAFATWLVVGARTADPTTAEASSSPPTSSSRQDPLVAEPPIAAIIPCDDEIESQGRPARSRRTRSS